MITAICQCDNDGLTAFYPIFGPEAFRVTHGLGVASRDDRVHPPRDQHGRIFILIYAVMISKVPIGARVHYLDPRDHNGIDTHGRDDPEKREKKRA